jgi:hypothetical protein
LQPARLFVCSQRFDRRRWGGATLAHAGARSHQNPTPRSGRENKLVDSEPKKLYHALPVLFVTGVQAKDRRRAGIYEAPCYRVKARRGNNFITTFALRTEDDKAKWVMRGVALLCSVD